MRYFILLLTFFSPAVFAQFDVADTATLEQVGEFLAVGIIVLSFCLGAIFGHTR